MVESVIIRVRTLVNVIFENIIIERPYHYTKNLDSPSKSFSWRNRMQSSGSNAGSEDRLHVAAHDCCTSAVPTARLRSCSVVQMRELLSVHCFAFVSERALCDAPSCPFFVVNEYCVLWFFHAV